MKIRRIQKKLINPAPYNPRKDLKPGDSDGCKKEIEYARRVGKEVRIYGGAVGTATR